MSKGFDSLADEIVQAYSRGMDDITAQAMEAAKKRAKECRDSIKRDSPSKSRNYSKGWRLKKVKDGYEVYNKNRPNIEMPLEHGHVFTKGKNKGKRAAAKPHIYKNADKARDDFINDCIKIAGKGGSK